MRIGASASAQSDWRAQCRQGQSIKGLLRELKQGKVRIYTSILTVQEVSVLSFMRGSIVTDNHTKVAKLARIAGITKEIALTAAKHEAIVREAAKQSGETDKDVEQNRPRKWDCFHMAGDSGSLKLPDGLRSRYAVGHKTEAARPRGRPLLSQRQLQRSRYYPA